MTDWASQIENDLKWREAELASLKLHAISVRENEVAYRSSLRALWAMLYAHYEGFTKFCWELVLDQIERASVRRDDLVDSLAILSLEKFFSTMRGDTSSRNLWRCYQREIPRRLSEIANFHADHRPSTDSNLWPSVFRRETSRYGISCTEIDRSEALVAALVSRRNKIAHGETMIIRSLNEYETYEAAATLVMHELAVEILDLLEKELYLKQEDSETNTT